MAYRQLDRMFESFDRSEKDIEAFSTKISDEAISAAAVNSSYGAPGGISDLDSQNLIDLWNKKIVDEYNGLQVYHSRFFSLDHTSITNGIDVDTVRWAADPAEPNFCFDEKTAIELSDWRLEVGHPLHSSLSAKGRRETHNEYCEYRIKFSQDSSGKIRAKRVVFSTELREYWMMLAEASPERLAAAATDALGRTPSWIELYGPGVNDPTLLSPHERRLLFAVWVSGAGGESELMAAGAPVYPIGQLNNLEALFMMHQINGLDDLLYIVLYGAHPYARRVDGSWVKATKDEIFSKTHFGESNPPIQLACRHADPAAAVGAASQAFDGRQVAFADPLGMYILGFADQDFLFDGQTLPKEWIKFSRGKGEKFYQRLEFGPPDDVDHYLDEITVGDEETPVQGGFQVAQRIEVGPWVRVGPPSDVSDTEYQAFEVDKLNSPYNCSQAGVCRRLGRLKDEYDEWRWTEV